MISSELKKFMALGQLLSPTLIDAKRCGQPDLTDEQATVKFRLEEKFPIGSIMDLLEDELELLLLYHGTHKDNPRLHECCFYANPNTSQLMFKVNVSTDATGFTDFICVAVYDSIEIWEQGLESDLASHIDMCDMIEADTEVNLVSLFCKLGYDS